ncbi:MAG: AmmeMemoRadiSam system protein B [Gaiellales bacterium]|nr:MAG: AmmeMemoRadiSam system protein B [Gaiellales bacterium]
MGPQKAKVREPAVAGQFYPGTREALEASIREMTDVTQARRAAIGVMVPHAGYMYSGTVAGSVFGSVELPCCFIVIGPNHTGVGPAASIMTSGAWRTPCGEIPVDDALAGAILENSEFLQEDDSAHAFEHSIEVQLPFLQCLREDVRFVPISLMTASPSICHDVGHAVAVAVRYSANPVLLIASSDMTHYESQEQAKRKDELALGRLLELDGDGLLQTVAENHISMCGVSPAATMIYACHELGATEAELVRYRTSGDMTGDYRQVVGYAGVIIR